MVHNFATQMIIQHVKTGQQKYQLSYHMLWLICTLVFRLLLFIDQYLCSEIRNSLSFKSHVSYVNPPVFNWFYFSWEQHYKDYKEQLNSQVI